MPVGNIKWFDAKRGYGFIQPEDGSKDVFVGTVSFRKLGVEDLREGQKVKYKVREEHNGRCSAEILNLTT